MNPNQYTLRMVERRRDVYAAEVKHLLANGVSPVRIPEQIGVRPGNLVRALYRAGFPELGRLFNRVDVNPARRDQQRRSDERRRAR